MYEVSSAVYERLISIYIYPIHFLDVFAIDCLWIKGSGKEAQSKSESSISSISSSTSFLIALFVSCSPSYGDVDALKVEGDAGNEATTV